MTTMASVVMTLVVISLLPHAAVVLVSAQLNCGTWDVPSVSTMQSFNGSQCDPTTYRPRTDVQLWTTSQNITLSDVFIDADVIWLNVTFSGTSPPFFTFINVTFTGFVMLNHQSSTPLPVLFLDCVFNDTRIRDQWINSSTTFAQMTAGPHQLNIMSDFAPPYPKAMASLSIRRSTFNHSCITACDHIHMDTGTMQILNVGVEFTRFSLNLIDADPPPLAGAPPLFGEFAGIRLGSNAPLLDPPFFWNVTVRANVASMKLIHPLHPVAKYRGASFLRLDTVHSQASVAVIATDNTVTITLVNSAAGIGDGSPMTGMIYVTSTLFANVSAQNNTVTLTLVNTTSYAGVLAMAVTGSGTPSASLLVRVLAAILLQNTVTVTQQTGSVYMGTALYVKPAGCGLVSVVTNGSLQLPYQSCAMTIQNNTVTHTRNDNVAEGGTLVDVFLALAATTQPITVDVSRNTFTTTVARNANIGVFVISTFLLLPNASMDPGGVNGSVLLTVDNNTFVISNPTPSGAVFVGGNNPTQPLQRYPQIWYDAVSFSSNNVTTVHVTRNLISITNRPAIANGAQPLIENYTNAVGAIMIAGSGSVAVAPTNYTLEVWNNQIHVECSANVSTSTLGGILIANNPVWSTSGSGGDISNNTINVTGVDWQRSIGIYVMSDLTLMDLATLVIENNTIDVSVTGQSSWQVGAGAELSGVTLSNVYVTASSVTAAVTPQPEVIRVANNAIGLLASCLAYYCSPPPATTVMSGVLVLKLMLLTPFSVRTAIAFNRILQLRGSFFRISGVYVQNMTYNSTDDAALLVIRGNTVGTTEWNGHAYMSLWVGIGVGSAGRIATSAAQGGHGTILITDNNVSATVLPQMYRWVTSPFRFDWTQSMCTVRNLRVDRWPPGVQSFVVTSEFNSSKCLQRSDFAPGGACRYVHYMNRSVDDPGRWSAFGMLINGSTTWLNAMGADIDYFAYCYDANSRLMPGVAPDYTIEVECPAPYGVTVSTPSYVIPNAVEVYGFYFGVGGYINDTNVRFSRNDVNLTLWSSFRDISRTGKITAYILQMGEGTGVGGGGGAPSASIDGPFTATLNGTFTDATVVNAKGSFGSFSVSDGVVSVISGMKIFTVGFGVPLVESYNISVARFINFDQSNVLNLTVTRCNAALEAHYGGSGLGLAYGMQPGSNVSIQNNTFTVYAWGSYAAGIIIQNPESQQRQGGGSTPPVNLSQPVARLSIENNAVNVTASDVASFRGAMAVYVLASSVRMADVTVRSNTIHASMRTLTADTAIVETFVRGMYTVGVNFVGTFLCASNVVAINITAQNMTTGLLVNSSVVGYGIENCSMGLSSSPTMVANYVSIGVAEPLPTSTGAPHNISWYTRVRCVEIQRLRFADTLGVQLPTQLLLTWGNATCSYRGSMTATPLPDDSLQNLLMDVQGVRISETFSDVSLTISVSNMTIDVMGSSAQVMGVVVSDTDTGIDEIKVASIFAICTGCGSQSVGVNIANANVPTVTLETIVVNVSVSSYEVGQDGGRYQRGEGLALEKLSSSYVSISNVNATVIAPSLGDTHWSTAMRVMDSNVSSTIFVQQCNFTVVSQNGVGFALLETMAASATFSSCIISSVSTGDLNGYGGSYTSLMGLGILLTSIPVVTIRQSHISTTGVPSCGSSAVNVVQVAQAVNISLTDSNAESRGGRAAPVPSSSSDIFDPISNTRQCFFSAVGISQSTSVTFTSIRSALLCDAGSAVVALNTSQSLDVSLQQDYVTGRLVQAAVGVLTLLNVPNVSMRLVNLTVVSDAAILIQGWSTRAWIIGCQNTTLRSIRVSNIDVDIRPAQITMLAHTWLSVDAASYFILAPPQSASPEAYQNISFAQTTATYRMDETAAVFDFGTSAATVMNAFTITLRNISLQGLLPSTSSLNMTLMKNRTSYRESVTFVGSCNQWNDQYFSNSSIVLGPKSLVVTDNSGCPLPTTTTTTTTTLQQSSSTTNSPLPTTTNSPGSSTSGPTTQSTNQLSTSSPQATLMNTTSTIAPTTTTSLQPQSTTAPVSCSAVRTTTTVLDATSPATMTNHLWSTNTSTTTTGSVVIVHGDDLSSNDRTFWLRLVLDTTAATLGWVISRSNASDVVWNVQPLILKAIVPSGAQGTVDLLLSAPASGVPLVSDSVVHVSMKTPGCLLDSIAADVVITRKTTLVSPAVSSAVATTAGAVGIASSLMGAASVSSAVTTARFKAFLELSGCSFDHTNAMDFVTSPTQLCFGDEVGQCYRGGVVGNIALFAGISLLIAMVGVVVVLAKRNHAESFMDGVSRGLLLMHFPSMFIVPFSVVVEGLSVTSTATIVHAVSATDYVIGACGYAVIIGVLCYGWTIVTGQGFPLVLIQRHPSNHADEDKGKQHSESSSPPAPHATCFSAVFHSKLKWTHRQPNAEIGKEEEEATIRGERFKQLHLHVFNDFCRPFYPVFELTIGASFGIFEGLRLSDNTTGCWTASLGVCLLTFSLFMVCIVTRPAMVLFESLSIYILNALATAASITLLTGNVLDNDALQGASDSLSLAGMLLSALKIIISLLVTLYMICQSKSTFQQTMQKRLEKTRILRLVKNNENKGEDTFAVHYLKESELPVVVQRTQVNGGGQNEGSAATSVTVVTLEEEGKRQVAVDPDPEEDPAAAGAFHREDLFDEIKRSRQAKEQQERRKHEDKYDDLFSPVNLDDVDDAPPSTRMQHTSSSTVRIPASGNANHRQAQLSLQRDPNSPPPSPSLRITHTTTTTIEVIDDADL